MEIKPVEVIIVPISMNSFRKLTERKKYLRPSVLSKTGVKYIAFYQIAPISAITHVAEINSVQCITNFWIYTLKNIKKMKKPLERGDAPAIQSKMYCTKMSLDTAKNLADIYASKKVIK